ncbi:hypothetical protein FSARC_14405 [Fusarium sarcochroum]|uniref:Uncharacterized protein n=1 Tax=Fusarium sarcochroum TaxID=1208366 RepID=A0A8H4WPU0_9HYPO|nr:hypothetical protein FSARC_14405 [Fusarium sarcochroum]
MPYGTQIVIIINWWLLNAHEPRPPSPSKRKCCSHGPLHITALLYDSGNGGLISNKIAEKLIGTKEQESSNFPSVVGISWTFDGPNQDLETSQVQVVPGLDQDLVLGNNTDELYQSVHFDCSQTSALHQLQPIQPETAVSSFGESFAGQINAREYIENQGIIPANQRSLEVFVSLLDLYRPKAPAPLLEERKDPMEASLESLHSSTFDEASNIDSEGDWATTCDGSEHGYIVSLSEPSYVNSLTDPSEHDTWETPSQLSGTTCSASQPGTPAHGWSWVGENQCISGTEEHMIDDSQLSDFETHPGHRFWVWDTQSERWRRRGRSGLEERDWFTETSSQ